MRSFTIIVILLPITLPVSGQRILDDLSKKERKRYNKVTNHARHAPSAITTNLPSLADYLTEEAKSDLEKARGIFIWVANNIVYDMKAFLSGDYPSQDIETVLKSRVAVCEGFANLIHALCEEAGLNSWIINGYSKGYGYLEGQSFSVSDHSWNAVKIEEKWYLLDATWAAPETNHPDYQNYGRIRDVYFLTPPEKFVLNHLPADPYWQLLNKPVGLDVFEKGDQKIEEFLTNGDGNFDFEKAIDEHLKMDASAQKIAYYTRSSKFNPRNKKAKYNLGLSIFFKALDSLELIHEIELHSIDELPRLESKIYELLDEAAFHFSKVPENDPIYQDAKNLLEEVTYQKGVFKYEAGQRVLDIWWAMDKNDYKKYQDRLKKLINNYYNDAISYFNLIDPESRYYTEAMEYVHHYIEKFRPE